MQRSLENTLGRTMKEFADQYRLTDRGGQRNSGNRWEKCATRDSERCCPRFRFLPCHSRLRIVPLCQIDQFGEGISPMRIHVVLRFAMRCQLTLESLLCLPMPGSIRRHWGVLRSAHRPAEGYRKKDNRYCSRDLGHAVPVCSSPMSHPQTAVCIPAARTQPKQSNGPAHSGYGVRRLQPLFRVNAGPNRFNHAPAPVPTALERRRHDIFYINRSLITPLNACRHAHSDSLAATPSPIPDRSML